MATAMAIQMVNERYLSWRKLSGGREREREKRPLLSWWDFASPFDLIQQGALSSSSFLSRYRGMLVTQRQRVFHLTSIAYTQQSRRLAMNQWRSTLVGKWAIHTTTWWISNGSYYRIRYAHLTKRRLCPIIWNFHLNLYIPFGSVIFSFDFYFRSSN